MRQLGLFSLTAQAGVSRRSATDARKRAEESAAARAARRQRGRTLKVEVEDEFREAQDKRRRDPRMHVKL
jgi:hypothetical protein